MSAKAGSIMGSTRGRDRIIIIIIDHFCTALVSDVHKLTALYRARYVYLLSSLKSTLAQVLQCQSYFGVQSAH